MNHNLESMLTVSEGRYLTELEKNLYKSYYDSLPQRFTHAKEVEQNESQLIQATVKNLMSKYPQLGEMLEPETKGQRDMTYLLRAATMAMIQNDYHEFIPKVAFVFDIFNNLNFPQGSIEFAYDSLRSNAKEMLSEQASQAMMPFLNALSPARVKAWQELNSKMPKMVGALSEYALTTHSQIFKPENNGEHLRKDMKALLGACGQAMLAQSEQPIEDVKAWLYGFFKELNFGMDFVFETYAKAPEIFAQHLSEETLNAFKPYLAVLTRA